MRRFGFPVVAIVVTLLCAVSSCKYSKEYQVVNVGNKFSIGVPSWMKEQEKLALNAQFQYANRFRNFYAIGMIMEKDTAHQDMNTLLRTNTDSLKAHLTKPMLTDSTAVTIGGLTGARLEIMGKMSGENIYFTELYLEGKSRYYHFSVWTRGEERKLKFRDDITRILESFKEI